MICAAGDARLARALMRKFLRLGFCEEVDVVPEDRTGQLGRGRDQVGTTVRQGALRRLNRFRDLAGDRFVAGLVLCTARQTTPLGRRV